ncbi:MULTISPECIES: WYL domain-containing protein [Vagococcus]|uniref:Transcriptional regulator, DeoR family n=1 Tax=Vagococcus fluvialis bH819 TaxID=1255619 RepID=A0A1X6WQU1_9ENTE|nr:MULTISPECIES: WYL domain-containing protein [Vagococcus]SLM86650.1 Transcriptional regulator, DeoR family [Vagococcus fluvialis bH819]HCM90858.1 WYL domain-containing protein [Vagococcus sp.]
MKKNQRLYEILWFMQQQKRFTATEIATRFDISTRTVQRYIVDLEDMGIFIEATKGKNGGMELISQPLLPPILFNQEEVISIFFAIHAISYIKPFPFKFNTEQAKQKLLSISHKQVQSQIIHLEQIFEIKIPDQKISAPFTEEIIQACLKKRIISGMYHSSKKRSKKKLEPVGVYFQSDFWYLYATDCELEDIRHFRIDRFESLEVSNETFHSTLTLNNLAEKITTKETFQVGIHLSNIGVMRSLENQLLAPYLTVNQDSSGYLDLPLAKEDIDYTFSYLMTLGKHATIEKPEWLINKFLANLEDIKKNYT